jgi:hypothetical protein
MKFEDQYDLYLKKYPLHEGIMSSVGKAIADVVSAPVKAVVKASPLGTITKPENNPYAEFLFKDRYDYFNRKYKNKVVDKNTNKPLDSKIYVLVEQEYINKKINSGDNNLLRKVTFIKNGANLGKFKFNLNQVKSKNLNVDKILLPLNRNITPNTKKEAYNLFAESDMTAISFPSDMDTDLLNIIKNKLKEKKIDGYYDEKEILKVIKDSILNSLRKLSLPEDKSLLAYKVVWFFIFSRVTILR